MPDANRPQVTTSGAAAPGPDTTPSWPTPPLPTLGGYRLLEQIGQGGMGLVYRAEDVRLAREVAIKVMRPEAAANSEARARFLREGKAQACVESPLIVPIYAAEEQNGVPYLVMPLLRGQTLEARLQHGKPPLVDVVRIAREAAEGVAAAHAAGLVHRDIKPGNIWLDEAGRVRLMDFGLARHEADSLNTIPGQVMGTPAYMAPEQAVGAPVDQRTDLYALGGVLYTLLTGQRPRPGQVRAAADIHAQAPSALLSLTAQLLASDPAHRPASAEAVAAELRRIEAGLIAPPRFGLWLVVAVGAACLLMALAVAFYSRRGEPEKEGPPPPPPKGGETPPAPDWAASLKKMTREAQKDAVRQEMMRRNPGYDGKMQFHTWGEGRYVKAEIHSTEVSDLAPLAALPGLADLECYGQYERRGKLASLEPLRGLKLWQAGFSNNPVRDLSPLEGMPLRSLWLSNIAAADLSPVYTLKRLRVLHLTSTSPEARLDAGRLSALPLEDVWFTPSQVVGFARLREWKGLKEINGKQAAEFWRTWKEK